MPVEILFLVSKQAGTGEFVLPLVPTTKWPFLGSLATSVAEVTNIVTGGTKNNLPPGLVTSPKATFLETPRVITESTIQDGKSKEENHNGPVDTAQERFSLGLWCPHKYEKQIVLKFMVFWQFDLASLN